MADGWHSGRSTPHTTSATSQADTAAKMAVLLSMHSLICAHIPNEAQTSAYPSLSRDLRLQRSAATLAITEFHLGEQSKIAEVLSTVDRAIEQTEALIAKQQRIKTGLTQDLLTRGIDEHGNIRSEKTHKFKNSPLGRIPVEWNPMPFGSCGQWFSGGTPSKTIRRFWGGGVPWVCPKDMKQFELHQSIDTITGDAVAAGARLMPTGTVFIVIRGMILAHTFTGRSLYDGGGM